MMIGLLLLLPCVVGMIVELDARTTQCFQTTVRKKGENIHFHYDVVRMNKLASVSLVSKQGAKTTSDEPSLTKLYNEVRCKSKRWEGAAPHPGRFELCFTADAKTTVEFDLWRGDGFSGSAAVAVVAHAMRNKKAFGSKAEKAQKEKRAEMWESVTELSDKVFELVQNQDTVRAVDRELKEDAERTESRVIWTSVGEAFVVTALSIGQVVMMKRYFEVKQVV